MRKMAAPTSAVPRLLAAAILFPMLPVVLAGCFQMNLDTIIQADGSGTFAVDYGMSQTVAEAMKELQALQGEDASAAMLSGFDRAELEGTARQHGVAVQSFTHEVVEGRERFRMRLAFPDLEALSGVLGSKGGGGMALYRLPDGNYQLVSAAVSDEDLGGNEATDEDGADRDEPEGDLGGEPEGADAPEDAPERAPEDALANDPPDDPDAPRADPEEAQQQMAKTMELMGRMMGAMSELQVQMRVTVPGDIVSHNAHRVEGRTLIWEVDAQKAMTMGEVVPEVVFSGRGLQIEAPPLPR